MALLETGIYTITNVRFHNLAVLQNANDGSEVVGRPEEDHTVEKVCCKVRSELFSGMSYDSIQWNVTRLKNKNYTFENTHHGSFACSDYRAKQGDNIIGRTRKQEWVIKNTRVQSRYTSVYFHFHFISA